MTVEANPADDDFFAVAVDSVSAPGRPCRVGEVLRQLDESRPEVAASARRALAQPTHLLQNVAIAKAFAKFGHPEISDGMIGHHRGGKCRNCYERQRADAA